MATYKVLSDNFSGKACGDIVTFEELEGLSIEALIIGGHIEPATKPSKKAEAE